MVINILIFITDEQGYSMCCFKSKYYIYYNTLINISPWSRLINEYLIEL